MSVELIRLFVVLLSTAAGRAIAEGGAGLGSRSGGGGTAVLVGTLLGACVGYVAGGVLGRLLQRVMGTVEERAEEVPAVSLLGAALGAIACGALAALVSVPAGLFVATGISRSGHGHGHGPAAIPWVWGTVAVLVWLGLVEGWRVGRRKSADFARPFADPLAANPQQHPQPPQAGDGALVDTSAIIDGRLLNLARTGFLPRPLYLCRFVLDEIQGLADGAEPSRRRRARRGLELLGVLRHEPGCDLRVLEDEVPELDDVDAKLVALARRLGVGLVTVDGPLEAVAELQGVRCFNLARLADELRPAHVPGDIVPLALSRPGREPGQAVGFLEDGTMVVVAGAADLIGQEVTVRVGSGVKTSMGRMLFATVCSGEGSTVGS